MARKKDKDLVTKTPTGKEVANIDAQLAEEAENIQTQIGAPATKNISTKDKQFTLPGGLVLQAPLDIVIIDFLSMNSFYPEKYNASNPQPPVCFAISRSPTDMTPSKNGTDVQAKSCGGCPMNEWGSDGDGKACKNTRVMAVMLASDDAATGEIYTMSVSPTALKAFDGYVGSISKLFKAAPIKVVTSVMFHPEKDYPSLMFGPPQPNGAYAVHFSRRAESSLLLEAEPDYSGADTKKTKKKAARRR